MNAAYREEVHWTGAICVGTRHTQARDALYRDQGCAGQKQM